MPFNGETYDDIVMNNLEAKIDFNFDKMNVILTKECLLNSNRFDSKDARKNSRKKNLKF